MKWRSEEVIQKEEVFNCPEARQPNWTLRRNGERYYEKNQRVCRQIETMPKSDQNDVHNG